jgi:aminoglycoside phosphotransferase (APT) family kinase protein
VNAETEVARLAAWLEAHTGARVALREPAGSSGDGFDSDVYFLRLDGTALAPEWRRPLVLRVKPDGASLDDARREAAIQGWVAARGYPAPRVLAVLEPDERSGRPAQVMERAPGEVMLTALLRRPWGARRATHQLASLHAQLHRLPVDGFPADDDLVDRRLRLVRQVVGELDDKDLCAALHAVESLGPRLRDAPPSVCHGDFHPLNVVVSGSGAVVIDWTDAGIGDRHGDVARTRVLFDVAHIAATNRTERRVLRHAGPLLGRAYLGAYGRLAGLDRHRVDLWVPLHLLHGWCQMRALDAGLFDRSPGGPRKVSVPPGMAGELRRRFEAALDRVR